jgi:hypothetical protein
MLINKNFLEVDYILGLKKDPYLEQEFYNDEPFCKIHINKDITHNYINSLGFRSDEFTDVHNDLHVLFSGCSFTWGTGLDIEQTWAYKLYQKINSDKECSGFFNLGSPGTSFIFQISNLFKYFKSYGNPNILFLNMTEILRFYSYSISKNVILDAKYKREYLPIFKILVYQNYLLLEEYCKTNNIKLISFSWEQETENFLNTFKTFYKMDQDKIYKDIHDNFNKNSSNLESTELMAKDNLHYGEIFHEVWYKKIYEKYLNLL